LGYETHRSDQTEDQRRQGQDRKECRLGAEPEDPVTDAAGEGLDHDRPDLPPDVAQHLLSLGERRWQTAASNRHRRQFSGEGGGSPR
jgi:hypothetical protein